MNLYVIAHVTTIKYTASFLNYYTFLCFVVVLTKAALPAKKSDMVVSNVPKTADRASVEFGILLNEILKELKKNESENLRLLKRTSSTLTVKDTSGVRMFSDSEVEEIYACNDIETLLVVKLRHCYRWDDHSMLNVLMLSLNAMKSVELLEDFRTNINIKMKLQEIYEQCLKEKCEFPEGYHKMVAIVDKKVFSSITKEEYDELKQFISQHCGVEPYVMSPFSKASPFSSVVFEWFIPVSVVPYMIETAKNNAQYFTKTTFLYLKISSEMILDHRKNVRSFGMYMHCLKLQVQQKFSSFQY